MLKVKVTYEQQKFFDAEVEVKEDELLAYINEVGTNYYQSLDAVRADEDEDFEYLLREYLEEEVFKTDALLVGITTTPAGPTEYEIDRVAVD
jgi:hypothetical protein